MDEPAAHSAGTTPIDPGVFTTADGQPWLIGSQCARCGIVTFPRQPRVGFTHVYGAPGVSACAVLTT